MLEIELQIVKKEEYLKALDVVIASIKTFKLLPNSGFGLQPTYQLLNELDKKRIQYKPSLYEIELTMAMNGEVIPLN